MYTESISKAKSRKSIVYSADKVVGEWGKLHKEKHHIPHSSPSITREIYKFEFGWTCSMHSENNKLLKKSFIKKCKEDINWVT
jgi:hypothetical protein